MDSRQQQYQQQRPAYPQVASDSQSGPASTTSSAFQSTSSLTSVHLPYDCEDSMMLQGQNFVSAPLPSPSCPKTRQSSNGYFGSTAQPANGPTSHPQQQQQHHLNNQASSNSRLPAQQQFTAQPLLGQRGGEAGGVPETAPFLLDANLLAEAAKRAQMACLMRDMDDIAL